MHIITKGKQLRIKPRHLRLYTRHRLEGCSSDLSGFGVRIVTHRQQIGGGVYSFAAIESQIGHPAARWQCMQAALAAITGRPQVGHQKRPEPEGRQQDMTNDQPRTFREGRLARLSRPCRLS